MTTTKDPSRENPFTKTLSIQIVLDERDVFLIQSQHIRECFFIEDIFAKCITGKLTFTDVHGLFERGPLTGNELIHIIYGADETREMVFEIWKVINIIQASPTNSTDESLVELIFVDTSFYNMFVTKYSYSFSPETKYTDIAKYFLTNMVGWESNEINLEVGTNFSSEPIALPYWTVSESIDWILKRTRSQTTGKSGYLCYNNTEDGWRTNVRTLDFLFSDQNFIDSATFHFESGDENVQGKNKIWEWWMDGINKNAMEKARGGVWKGYDSKQRKFLTAQYTYADGIEDVIAMGKASLYADLSDPNSFHRLTGERTLEELELVAYNDWVKNYDVQQQVNIITPGNEKRYAGSQIEIEWPSIERHEFDNTGVQFQKQMKGKYLVRSVIHSFAGVQSGSNINYVQRLQLLKNAYQETDASSLLNIPAEHQNIGIGKDKADTSFIGP
jgi:hypothetical protein